MTINAQTAIYEALNGKRVLYAVDDSRAIGAVWQELHDAIRIAGVNGFDFGHDKPVVKHASGGSITITCDKSIRGHRLDGQWFDEMVGKESVSSTAMQLAKSLLRAPR